MKGPISGFLSGMLSLAVLSGPARADDVALCNSALGDTAVSACSRLIAGNARGPNLGLAHLKRGVGHFRLGKLDAARQDMEVAERLRPTDPDPTFNLGVIAQRMGDSDKARSFFRKALDRDPSHRLSQDALKRLAGFDALEERLNARTREIEARKRELQQMLR
jgi:Tfp pilus assembly protein PilF